MTARDLMVLPVREQLRGGSPGPPNGTGLDDGYGSCHPCDSQPGARFGGEPCDNPGVNSVVRRPLVRRFTSREDLPQERVYLTKRFTTGEKIHHRREDLPHEEIYLRRRFTTGEKIYLTRGDLPRRVHLPQERFTTGEKIHHRR